MNQPELFQLMNSAANIIKSMPASFKTMEVPEFFGWAWLSVYRSQKPGTPTIGPQFVGTDTYTALLTEPTGEVGFRLTTAYHLVSKQDLSYEFAGVDNQEISWDYEVAADGSVALEKQPEKIDHSSADGHEAFFTYQLNSDTPSFPRLNALYNVRLSLTMKATAQVTRNQGPTAKSTNKSLGMQFGGGGTVSSSDTYTLGSGTTNTSNSVSIALAPWQTSIGPYRVNLIPQVRKKTIPPELRSLLKYEVLFKIGLHVPMDQDALEAHLRRVEASILGGLIEKGKVHFHLSGWASNIGRKHPNPTKPNSFNNDDLALDRLNFVRMNVMKKKFGITVRDEFATAPAVPLTPNPNPQIDQVVIITLDEAEVMAAL